MISPKCVAATCVMVIAFSSGAAGQTSLKDYAIEHGGSATSVINQEFPRLSVEEMTRKSDLVLRGRISQVTPRLSDDESLVYTDYSIAPVEILKGARLLSVADKPGPLLPLLIQQVGGSITVSGLHLKTQTDLDGSGSPLVRGGEYVFFLTSVTPSSLTKHARLGVYQFVAGPRAAFKIQNGKIAQVSKEAEREQSPLTDDAALFLTKLRWMLNNQ